MSTEQNDRKLARMTVAIETGLEKAKEAELTKPYDIAVCIRTEFERLGLTVVNKKGFQATLKEAAEMIDCIEQEEEPMAMPSPTLQGLEDVIGEVEEDQRTYIAKLLRQGYTSGNYPKWRIIAETCVLEDDAAIQTIAKLIEEGNREGHYPHWQLELE